MEILKNPRILKILSTSDQRLLFFVLTAVSFLLYFQSCFYSYAYDDILVFSENRFVLKGFQGIPDIFNKESFAGFYEEKQNLLVGARYRPLSLVSFAIEHAFFGKLPQLSHIINVFLYALCAFWVYRIVKKFQLVEDNIQNNWLALISAILFLLHPVHSEVVANIKGRDELFAFLFLFIALDFCLMAIDKHKPGYRWIGSCFLCLSYLSKEHAICAILLIPICLYFFRKISVREIALQLWIVLLPLIVFLWLRQHAVGTLFIGKADFNDLMNNPFIDFNLNEKIATIIYCLAWYLKLLLIPYPLTHDYYPYHVAKMNFTQPLVWLSILLIAVIFYSGIRNLQKQKIISFSILFFMISIFLVSNIPFSIGTFMNERFLFLPSFAFCLVVSYGILALIKSKFYVAQFIIPMIFLASVILCWNRIPAWKNTESLYLTDLSVSKKSARIQLYTGIYFFTKYQQLHHTAYLSKAGPYIDEALRIAPNYRLSSEMKYAILAEQHKLDKDLNKFLHLTEAYVMQYPDMKNAIQYFEYLNTDTALAPLLFAYYNTIAYNGLFKQKHDFENALRYLGMAHQLNPSDILTMQRIVELYNLYAASEGISSDNINLYHQQANLFQDQINRMQQSSIKK